MKIQFECDDAKEEAKVKSALKNKNVSRLIGVLELLINAQPRMRNTLFDFFILGSNDKLRGGTHNQRKHDRRSRR